MISVGRKNLTQFDAEKDEWYYQPKIYVNRRDSDSLYNELKEFRQSLSKEQDGTFFTDRFSELLAEGEQDDEPRRLAGEIPVKESKGMPGRPDDQDTGGFFDEKLQLLKDEIEDINRNLEERGKIEIQSGDSIDSEIRAFNSRLQEIYTWKIPNQQAVEFIRMEFLKQLASLYREKRSNSLNFWKDSVFEKRDRRNLLMEYKSLCWADELSGTMGKESKK